MKAKVLIVDDDPCFREFLTRVLTGGGYEVVEARSTMEAESSLLSGPDLLIVDYRMPGLDGVAWIKRLRERGNSLPIIFCSGSGCDQQKFSVMRNLLDVGSLLQKPINPASLLAQVEQLLPKRFVVAADSQILQDPQGPQDPQDAQRSPVTQDMPLESSLFADEESLPSISLDQDVLDDIALLRDDYLVALPEMLQQINLNVLMAAASRDPVLMSDAGNQAHMICGTAGSLGLSELSKIAGQLEELLDGLDIETLVHDGSKIVTVAELISEAEGLVKLASSNDGHLAEPPVAEHTGARFIPMLKEVLDSAGTENLSEQPETFESPSSVAAVLATPIISDGLVGPLMCSSPRLMIVAAEPSLCRECLSLLGSENLISLAVHSREEAVFYLAKFQPDVILVEEAFLLESTREFSEFVRTYLEKSVRIVAILDSLDGRESAIAAQVDDYVIKPLIGFEIRKSFGFHLIESTLNHLPAIICARAE